MNFFVAATQALLFAYIAGSVWFSGIDTANEAGWFAVSAMWSLIGFVEVVKDGRGAKS